MRTTATATTTPTAVKGPSLARGPAWIVGTILSVFGLILFFEVSGTPLQTGGFPDGAAVGDHFIGFEANAWTAWLTTAAGVLVLIGAAQHASAKLLSLVVGLALGAAAVIALFDGNDVLGLAAANGLTALGWGIAAAVLIVTALLPRLGRKEPVVVDDRAVVATGAAAERNRTRTAEPRVVEPVAGQARTTEPRVAEPVASDPARRDVAAQPVATGADDPRTATVTERATGVAPSGSEDQTRVHHADGSEDETRVQDTTGLQSESQLRRR